MDNFAVFTAVNNSGLWFSGHKKCDTLKSCLRKDVFHMAYNGNLYPEEFKRQIFDLYLSGKPVKELADE